MHIDSELRTFSRYDVAMVGNIASFNIKCATVISDEK